jgi:hypothetical protein
MQVKCANCTAVFAFAVGKRFHSEECRKNFHADRRTEKQFLEWKSAIPLTIPAELQGQAPSAIVRAMLRGFIPAGGSFVRLGCPRPGTASAVVRWFPVKLIASDRSCWSLDPYEEPQVPVPGDYLLAVLSPQQQLIERPRWKIHIPFFAHGLSWSRGSRRWPV